jgi:hypothetical protein
MQQLVQQAAHAWGTTVLQQAAARCSGRAGSSWSWNGLSHARNAGARHDAQLLQTSCVRWYRSQELSRDRAGLLACRSVRVAVTTLLKLNVRPPSARVSVDAVEPQVQEVAHGRRRWGEGLATLGLCQPLLMRRIRRLIEWAGPLEPAPASSAE